MRKAKRAVEWTPEGMQAWWDFWEFFSPSFDRMVRAQNTPLERQAKEEHAAILKVGRERYEQRLREIEACLAR